MLREMELRHLRYFVAVAEELSFTKTAQKLRLAQPSLTRQVRNLEEEIGVRLLNRANNRVALTDEGRFFLSDAKRLLSMCAQSVDAVQRMNRGERSQLNIGYVSNLHYGLLPATLGAFRKLSPDVALNLFDMRSAEQFQALDDRKIDLGFVGLRPALSHQEMRSESVAQDTMLVAVPMDHPLVKKTQIKLADLAPQFFIEMSALTHPGARQWLLHTCRSAGFAAKILQEADTEMTAIKFVVDGLGVALMPEQITGLSHQGTVFLPLSPAPPPGISHRVVGRQFLQTAPGLHSDREGTFRQVTIGLYGPKGSQVLTSRHRFRNLPEGFSITKGLSTFFWLNPGQLWAEWR